MTEFRLPEFLCHTLLKQLLDGLGSTPAQAPHGVTIGEDSDPYMRRWFVSPRGDKPACYLHQFLRSDDDRALHDHPWASCGIILAGGYLEHLPNNIVVERRVGDVIPREALHRHRVELHRDGDHNREAWTLFLTAERTRDWGFWCPEERFVRWQDFTEGPNGKHVGVGCG